MLPSKTITFFLPIILMNRRGLIKSEFIFVLKNDKISTNALEIIRKLNSEGYQAYLVGGAVRDILLDIKPKDYDISTNAVPEELKRLFGRRAKIIGRRFRLVHIHTRNEIIEVSTFRRMPTLQERKGRKSDSGLIVWRDNYYGTLEEDVVRRDFTINAIYYNPYYQEQNIVDHAGGLSDLKNHKVRCIGNPKTRLAEDPVRMLRACKLMGQYGFQLEGELSIELLKNAPNLQLSSRARLLEELFKILKKPFSFPIFQACYDVGILHYLLPVLAREWKSERGALCKRLLRIRDKKLQLGEIYPSRISGLALIIFPFLNFEVEGDPIYQIKKNHFAQNHFPLYSWIEEFLSPYRIPKYIISKLNNVFKMQSILLHSKKPGKIQLHPDYFRARDFYNIYSTLNNPNLKIKGKQVASTFKI